MSNVALKEIKEIIFSGRSIAVSAHTSPDGDAIGAACALAMAVNGRGGYAKVFLEKYADVFNVIPVNGIVENEMGEFKPEIYIAVDCGDMERLGGFKEAFAGSKIRINIDHHKSNTYFGDLNYVDTEASSTCEIIYKIVGDMLSSLNNADYIAGCIYSGIVFDTGGFRHTSTSSITLAAASELIKYKFDFSKIYNTIFNTRKFEEAKALGRAILNMEKLAGGEIVYSSMSQEEIKSCGTESDGLSEIINYLKGISGCKAAVFVYEKSTGVFKVSMRSEDDVDVSAVAQSFGGGGHAKAAGCTVEGSKKEILDKIIVEISKQLT